MFMGYISFREGIQFHRPFSAVRKFVGNPSSSDIDTFAHFDEIYSTLKDRSFGKGNVVRHFGAIQVTETSRDCFERVNEKHIRFLNIKSHTIHGWYVYLHFWLIFRVFMSVYMGLIIKGTIPRGPHHFRSEFGMHPGKKWPTMKAHYITKHFRYLKWRVS